MTPTEKKRVRAAVSNYCRRAEQAQLLWHYSQQRPYTGLGVEPERRHVNDCSSFVALVFHYAMGQTGLYLADPLGYSYGGWGYTGSQLDWLEKHGSRVPLDHRFYTGDMALYGAGFPSHTTICRYNGLQGAALWSSHGNEGGPNVVKLHYRDDLIGVWRHPALR